jgi:organic hydroperoxide reductase OsmC/OhrA
MHEFPHHYTVTATGAADTDVELTAERLPRLFSASPAEFDGPGDRWSPETFLVGAVADCFILTFRAVAHASKLPWSSLHCEVSGTLDRLDRATQFTHFDMRARLTVPTGTDPAQARRVLDKAERSCLITNSLKATVQLMPEIEVATDLVGALAGT